MRQFVADLHVHSILSPCAAVEMTPRNIVRHAEELGVDMIAITDHNACDNVVAAMEASKGTSVTVLPGMEVETKEEIHLVVLFSNVRQLRAWEKYVEQHLPDRPNDEQKLGAQFIVDAKDNLIRVKEKLLLQALDAPVAEITRQVVSLGGIAIASHVDRPVYSIFSQLGFIPPDVELAAIEVSRRIPLAEARARLPAIGRLPAITASDAHTIEEFISGPKTMFALEQPTLTELCLALRGADMRQILI